MQWYVIFDLYNDALSFEFVLFFHLFWSNRQWYGRYGTLCIRENPGCLFIATNRDAVGHMTDLQEWPGIHLCFLLMNGGKVSLTLRANSYSAFRCWVYGCSHLRFNPEGTYSGWEAINLHDGVFNKEVTRTWIFIFSCCLIHMILDMWRML